MPEPHRVYVGIGSNLDNPSRQVESACEVMAKHNQLVLLARSAWYRSKAVGPGQQPDYVNGAALLATSATPQAVLDILQEIELQHKRERILRWGPRTLDLDLLLYDDCVMRTPRLTLPHPQIARRNFVLRPLLDIDPQLDLPDGRKIAKILHIIGTVGLESL